MSSSSSRKSARIFSQSRLLTPTLILWIRMMVGSGRKKRKEEKKRKGTGPISFSIWVKGHMWWDLKNAGRRRGKGPIDVTYISIRLNPIFRQGFFLFRWPPVLLNLPTGYLDTYSCPSNQFPVPSTQSWLMHAFLHLFSLPSSIPASSVLHSPNIHGWARAGLMPYQHRHVHR